MVDAALAAPGADGCVRLGRGQPPGQPALGRTTPDHQRRPAGRRVTVICHRRPGRRDGGRRRRPRRRRPGRRRPGPRPRAGGPASAAGRRRAAAGRGAAPDAAWDDWRRAEHRPRGLRRLRPGAGRGLRRGPGRATACCSASPSTTVTTTYLGTSTGLRRRHVQPTGRARSSTPSRRRDAARPGPASATADFADVDVDGARGRAAPGVSSGPRGRIELPAGRYEVMLPPTAVADLMVDLLLAAGGPRRRRTAAPSSRAPGGGTRVGERLTDAPLRCGSDPAAPGLRVRPVPRRRRSSGRTSRSSTTAWRSGAPTGSPTGRSAACAPTGAGRAPGCRVDPGDRQPGPRGAGASGATWRTWSPAPSAALLLTCLWYIREVDPQTLLLTGLTRDGVYLVEDGEVVGAVNNFRFNESPVGLLGRVARRRHRTAPCRGSWATTSTAPRCRRCGSTGFNMSSVSQAS